MNLLQRGVLALFAIPSLEEKLQTLAKEKGLGRRGKHWTPSHPKDDNQKKKKKDLKNNQKQKKHGGQRTS